MRSLFVHELYKLAGRRSSWAVLLLLTVVNLVLTMSAINKRLEYTLFTPEEYRVLYEKLVLMPEHDALQWLEKEIKAHEDGLWEDFILYNTVRNELHECLTYDSHLRQIEDTADKLKNLSIFSGMDDFSYKNAEKTVSDFKKMEGVQPVIGPSMGIVISSKGVYTDILAVLAVFSMSMLLFTREKECNLSLLTRTTPNGGVRHGVSKMLAVLSGCIIVVLALYIPKLFLTGFLFGFGDLSRPIQSVAGYSGGTLRLSVTQFFLLSWGLKLAVLMVMGLLFSMIAIITRKAAHSFAFMACSLAGMYLLGLIPYWHPLSLFAVAQPLMWLRTEVLLCEYLNYNVFGLPVERLTVSIISLIIMIFVLTALIVFFYPRQQNISQRKKLRDKKGSTLFPPGIRKCRLFYGEIYKLLIQNKTLLILLLFCASVLFAYFAMPMRETFSSINDMYYKRITLLYEGKLTPEKETAIFNEAVKADLSSDSFMEKINSHLDYLRTKSDSELLYDTGYIKLTFGDLHTELWLLLIGVIVLIAMLGGISPVEYQTGAIVLIRSSLKGTAKVFRAKRIVSFCTTMLVGALLYIPYLFSVLNVYGNHALSAPAYSLPHLWFVPQNITILSAVLLCILIRFAVLCLLSRLMLWCSCLVKSTSLNYMVLSGIFAVPVLLCLLLTM